MAIFNRIKRVLGKNEIPGTAIGRFATMFIPNKALAGLVTAGDVIIADALEDAFSDSGDGNVDKIEVINALDENKQRAVDGVVELVEEALAGLDLPFVDGAQEEYLERAIVDQVRKQAIKAIENLKDSVHS